jgi:hypothetical protein
MAGTLIKYLQRKAAPLSVPRTDISKEVVPRGTVIEYVSERATEETPNNVTLFPFSMAVPLTVAAKSVATVNVPIWLDEGELEPNSALIVAPLLPVASYVGVDRTVKVTPFCETLGCA